MKLKVFIAFSVLVAFVIWLGLGSTGSKRVDVVEPKKGSAVQAVYATGTVEATVMMPIAARNSARLIALNVDEGSNVKKDQVLAQLEDEDLQAQLNELQAKEQFAREEFERANALLKENTVSKARFDQAKSQLDAAIAATKKMEAQLSYTRLVAPADGRIIQRDGEIGQLIPANQPVFWLSCCAPLRISAEVDEEDISLVQPGQSVLIRADAFPGEIYKGEVQSITPKGDSVARSYRVRIGFKQEVPLLIGMTAETNIITRETKDALLIPTNAVLQDKVWVVEDGKLAKRKVSLGAKGPKETEIIKGITMQDLVVLNPDQEFKNDDPVKTKLLSHKDLEE